MSDNADLGFGDDFGDFPPELYKTNLQDSEIIEKYLVLANRMSLDSHPSQTNPWYTKEQYAIPYNSDSKRVHELLGKDLSYARLQRLGPSVLQIGAQSLRATVIKLSPNYGVSSLRSMISMTFHSTEPLIALDSSPARLDLSNSERTVHFDCLHHYEHYLKQCNEYKDLDVLGFQGTTEHNNIAFISFTGDNGGNASHISTTQEFFIPTSKTWELQDTDAFIYGYSGVKIGDKTTEMLANLKAAFPCDFKLVKKGTIKVKRSTSRVNNCPKYPIAGVHSCSAVYGMEGSAIVSVKYPGELIGCHAGGIPYFEETELEEYGNMFVSVHHPRFVKFYFDLVIPDLKQHANEFFIKHQAELNAYVQLHAESKNCDLEVPASLTRIKS